MAASLTQKDVATALDWSESKLHRIENGPSRVQTSDLHAMLTLYGVVDEAERADVVELGRAARQPSVSSRYGRQLDLTFVEFLDYEAYADRYYNYQTKLVPGVIQMSGYADAVTTNLRLEPDDDEAVAVVDARTERAQYITGPEGPEAHFIIDEGALHRAVGGETMALKHKYDVMLRLFEHLNRLNTVGNSLREDDALDPTLNPRMSIQIVPYELGIYPALRGPFVLLEFDDDSPLVYLENPDRQQILRQPDETRDFMRMFEDAAKAIPGPEFTREILSFIAESFESRLARFPVPVARRG